jgi:hypothetical protein
MSRALKSLVLAAVLLAAPSAAKANDSSTLGPVLLLVASVGLPATALSMGLTNGLCAARNVRPDNESLVAGYLTGALNVATGIGVLQVWGQKSPFLELAVADIAVGALDILITMSAHGKTKRADRRAQLVPIAGTDIRGTPFAGLGLRVARF